MLTKRSYRKTQSFLVTVEALGDSAVCFASASLAYMVRFHTVIRTWGVQDSSQPPYITYLHLLIFGTICFIGTFAYLGLYNPRILLQPLRSYSTILKGTVFWLCFFLSVSLIFKLQPSISRIFVAICCVTSFVTMVLWRYLFFQVISHSRWRSRIVQRVAFVGWNGEIADTLTLIKSDRNHTYEIQGIITLDPTPAPAAPSGGLPPFLGSLTSFEAIITHHPIDIVVLAAIDLPRSDTLQIAALCEKHYVEFKIIPSFFQVFMSNLRTQIIAGVPILGVESLSLHSLGNKTVKRCIDIAGALIGLVISAPVIAILTVLIKLESPGPIFYFQRRTGRHGSTFNIIKLRSMRVDAEVVSGPRWAERDDPRRTKIGTFMRRTNLDELPQFWNVLKGEMSLVGPRPERPELIERFQTEIPHYNPRHEVKPGITGWAQVNGLRGNTSLTERIRFDLYYIENWSIWMDLKILLLTLVHSKNAY